MKKILTFTILSCLIVACGEPIEDSDQPTKEEIAAQGKADSGTDWCRVLDWYGDGICDTFCLNPDPDCGGDIDCTTAFVVPSCDPGYVLVDDTTCNVAGDDCESSTLCGVESNCLFVGEFCPQVVGTPPACIAGYEEVPTCETDQCMIERGTGDACTEIKFCEPELDCRAALVNPTCESNELTVDALTCNVAGSECRTVTECGVSAHCLFVGDVCPQVVGTPAACPGNTIEVETCQSEDCLIERGTGDQCDTVKFCEPAVTCLAIPSCQPGEINISTEACNMRGDACETVTVCSQTVHCWDYPKFCPQVVGTPPGCGANSTETSGCSTAQLNDGSCRVVNGTGDKCADYIYCLNN